MKIKSGSYNIPHIIFDGDPITPSTPTVVGTDKDYQRLVPIIRESGMAIIDYIKVGNDVLRGTVNIVRFYGGDEEGFDFGTVSNFGGEPTAITGTILLDDDELKLTLEVTEIPTE